jgi:hypothetical protein
MFERFTERAREVVVLAQDEARLLKHNYVGTEHLLLGSVRMDEGIAGMRDAPVRPARHSERPIRLEHVLAALHETKEALIEANEFEEAARVRNQQRRLEEQSGKRKSCSFNTNLHTHRQREARKRGRWRYTIVTLEGPSAAWPQQLAELRRDGWELLTIIDEGKDRQALLERRTGS